MTTSTRSRTGPRTAPVVRLAGRSDRRVRPVRRQLRGLLWRGRFAFAALAAGSAAAATVHAISPPPPDLAPVVVVDRAVAAGTALTAEDLRTVLLPAEAVPPDAVKDAQDAVGRAVAVDVTPGTLVSAPVLSTDLAAHAPPGTVIAAVRLAEPALAELLEPGMRVDLLAPAGQPAVSPGPAEVSGTAVPGTYLARGAIVQPVPRPDTDPQEGGVLSLGDPETGATTDLVLVAVTPSEAASLANMAGWSAISAVLVH